MKKLLVLLVILPLAGYAALKGYIYYQVKTEVDEMIAEVSPFVELRYGGVSSSLDGSVGITELAITVPNTNETLIIDQVSLHTPGLVFLLNLGDEAMQHELPERLAVSLQGVKLDLTSEYANLLDAAAAAGREQTKGEQFVCTEEFFTLQDYRAMGYQTLDIDVALGYRYQAADSILSVNFEVGTRDMYRMDLNLDFKMDSLPRTPQQLQRFEPLLVRGAGELNDDSFAERLTEYCMDKKSISREAAIELQEREMLTVVRNMGVEPDADMIAAYRRYLDAPKRLQVTAEPGEPVDLSHLRFYKASDVPRLLNLQVESL